MKSTLIKTISFIIILGAFIGLAAGISAMEETKEEKKQVDKRPLVSTTILEPGDYDVKLSSFGEVVPLEKTILSAQVNGEIISWNKDFVSGGIVKRGDILFTVEADQYEASVLQAEAQVSLAEATLSEELARQKVAMKEAKAIPSAQISDLYLRKPQVLSAKAQLKSAQAALRIAQRNLAKTKVVAPYDALVVSRDLGVGQYVSAGMQVAVLNNVENAEIIVPIAGFDQQFLKQDMTGVKAVVKLEGDNNNQRLGYVDRDKGIVDQNTRMLHLVVRVEDPYGLKSPQTALKFGSYVAIEFPGKTIQNVYKVPQSLVNNNKLWLVNNEDKLKAQKVNVIREEGSFFFIQAEFNSETRMAENLPEYPQNGMQVKIKNAEQDLLSFNQ